MRMLSFEEFKENGSYIYCKDEKDLKVMRTWLKHHKYDYLKGTNSYYTGDEMRCHNGSNCLTKILSGNHRYRNANDIYTVLQLTAIPKPPIKMTVAEIVDVLGYDIEIIK